MIIPPFLVIFNKKTGSNSEFKKNTIQHLDVLYNFALRMTGNENEAGKLIFETFRRAIRFFNMLDEETDYKTWLFRVIKNAYEDLYGKLPDKKGLENDENLYEEIKEPDIDHLHLDKTAYKDIPKTEIVKAIASLPEDLKTVIVLSDIEDFTKEKTVDFTDSPLSVVKSRLYKARKMLFKKLYDDVKVKEIITDLEIQSFIKNLISDKLTQEPTPEHIRKKIAKWIK